MNAKEINQLLGSRAEEVARMLLPNGKRDGHFWVCGDVTGKAGTSLKVHLEGQYVGFWKDFATGDGKSMLDLWMKTKQIAFIEALKEAAKWLNVELTNESKKLYHQKPATNQAGVKVDYVPLQEGSAVWAYLVDKRGIKPETLKAFGVCQTPDAKVIVFPYRSDDGKRVEMVKYIALDRDAEGKKKCWTSAGTSPALFGKETIRKDSSTIVICEGEIDAMTVWQCGLSMSALSVPYGAKEEGKDGKNPNDPWIAKEYEFLEMFENIYLCFDSDDPGRKAAAGLVKRLGVERCLLVRLPDDAKDPNDLLTSGREIELGIALGNAVSLDPDYLKSAEQFCDEVLERFFPKDGVEPGIEFMIRLPFRIRAGEVTLWTGYSGHGKTMLLSQLMADLMMIGQHVCIASMEIPAAMTLQNLWIQASARFKPKDEAEFHKFYAWFTGKLWIYSRMGDVDVREVLSVFRYASRRYGVKQFVLDSLDKLNVGRDDYDRQRALMNDLNALADEMGAHIHFVAHSRKPDHGDESNIPGKYEVSGSAVLTNLAWNGVTVWRNKAKEAALDPDNVDYEQDIDERGIIAKQHDAFFRVWKQRVTGDEPVKKLWYDRDAKQFWDKPDREPKIYAQEVL